MLYRRLSLQSIRYLLSRSMLVIQTCLKGSELGVVTFNHTTLCARDSMSGKIDSGKVYYRECTGAALETVKRHASDQDITLFAGCFCPFVQRVWVALEYLDIPYKVSSIPSMEEHSDEMQWCSTVGRCTDADAHGINTMWQMKLIRTRNRKNCWTSHQRVSFQPWHSMLSIRLVHCTKAQSYSTFSRSASIQSTQALSKLIIAQPRCNVHP